MTIGEVHMVFEGVSRRITREQNNRAWLAWHIEALSRTKKMPKFKDMLTGTKPSRRQSVDEQISIAHQWTSALSRR